MGERVDPAEKPPVARGGQAGAAGTAGGTTTLGLLPVGTVAMVVTEVAPEEARAATEGTAVSPRARVAPRVTVALELEAPPGTAGEEGMASLRP